MLSSKTGWVCALGVTLGLAGCASQDDDWVVYECEGNEVKVRMAENEASIESALFSGTLPRVESASGVKYSDGEKLFWTHAAEDGLAEFDGKRRLCLTQGEGLYSYSIF